jgi:hypothetical protein
MEHFTSEVSDHTRSIANSRPGEYVSRMPTGRQLAAAIALIGWNQSQLAEAAGLSLSSVQRALGARGVPTMTTDSLGALIRALEQSGVVFIDSDTMLGPGVRLRTPPALEPIMSRRRRRRAS